MSKSILPDGYLPAEFLESTGTQYIDTGIKLSNESEVRGVVSANPNTLTSFAYIYGGMLNTWLNSAHFVYLEPTRLGFGVGRYSTTLAVDTSYVSFVLNSSELRYNGNTKPITSTQIFEQPFTCPLFGYRRGDSAETPIAKYSLKIYNFSISCAGIGQCNYVSAITPAGVPCMYDSVTAQPFTNAGSGSFIVGISVEQAYALIDKLPVFATNSNFALTISLPYTAQYDTRLIDALNTTIDLYKLNLTVTYSDADTTRALSIKEAYALPNILPKLTEETAATLAIRLPYRAKYDTALLAALEELATTLYWTVTITYDSPVYPEDFHPADFIYSDGTAYLDIPIATDFTDKAIKVRTQHLFDATSSGTTYGEGVSSGTNATTLNWSRVNTLFGGFAGNSSVTLQNPTLYTDKYNTIELEIADNATKLAINGRTATATHTDSTELPEVIQQIGVFYMYGSTTLLPGKKRFWQLTLDDKVFYNLVPALTWEGVPCMVNTLTNEFYTTAGSADFTIGLSEEQAYTVLSTLLTTATTLPSITLPYCARANRKIQALLSEFETTDWVSYSEPVYPDDCIAITSVMQDGTIVDTSGNIPCIMIGSPWENTVSIYDLNLKAFRAAIPEYVAVISTEELRAIINRLKNYISIATANTSFSVQLPYAAQFDTELQTELIEFTMQSGYGVDVAYSNPIDHKDYIPATYLESSGEDSILLENPEGDDYNEYTGVRAQLAAVEKNEYNYLFYDFTALASFGLGVSENNVWRAAYGTVAETTAPVELDEQTTIEFNYKAGRQLNIGPAYRQTLSKWEENTEFNSMQLFYPSQITSSNVTGWKLKAWRILFSHYDKVIHDLNPGITYDGVPCFVDVINNITHRVPSYAIGMTVTQLRNLRKLPVTTDGVLNIQLPEYAVLDAGAIAAIEAAEAKGWLIQLGCYIRCDFLENTGTQWIDTGITLSNESEVNISYSLKQCGDNQYIFGTQTSWNKDNFSILAESLQYPDRVYAYCLATNGSGIFWRNFQIYGQRREMYVSSAYGSLDGVVVTNPAASEIFETVNSASLFTSKRFKPALVKIYSLSISRSGTSQLNYVPTLDAQGLPCMLDTVTMTPKYNAGTGNFIVGMTAKQARLLGNLPEGGGKLTISLPPDVVDENGALQDMAIFTALSAAEAKGWNFKLQTHDGTAVCITLPTSYIECEFLESTGIQHIKLTDTVDRDTGLMATYQTGEDKRWAYHYCYCTEKPNALSLPFGGDHPDQYYNKWVWCWYKWTFTDLPIPSPSDEYGPDYYTKRLTGAVNWKVSKGAGIQFEGASSFKGKTWYDSFVETYTGLTLCASSYKTFSVKVSQKQNITRDMVPAIAPSGVPCMFDKATQQPFYNDGEGSFIVGMTASQAVQLANLPVTTGETLTISLPPDVVDENGVLQDMTIFTALSAAAAKGWNFVLQTHDGTAVETAVPFGYMECEFLESTGEQTIMGEILQNDYVEGEFDFQFTQFTGTRQLFGLTGAGVYFGINIDDNWEQLYSPADLDIHTVKLGITRSTAEYFVELDNIRKDMSAGSWWRPETVLRCHPFTLSVVNYPCHIRSYGAKATDGTNLLCNYTPAISPDGVPCMYDSVSSTAKTNAGTGQFIVGMTASQAVQLSNLPVTTGETLTISLPPDVVDENGILQDIAIFMALSAAAAKGWSFILQTHDGTAVETAVPAGYMQCEFLENTGEQWLTTQNFEQNNIAVTFESQFTALSVASNRQLFGLSSTNPWLGVSAYGTAFAPWSQVPFDTDKHFFKIECVRDTNTCICAIEDLGVSSRKTITSGDPLTTALRAMPFSLDHGAYIATNLRCYSVVGLSDNVLAANLTPAITPAGVPCMYDSVSGKANFNAGSGKFIVGMTAAQAAQLANLPEDAADKKLTVSLPQSILNAAGEITDAAVNAALNKAADNGWDITLQYYTES